MWEVYKKEFLELARDKRTLMFTVLLPTIIIPLIVGGIIWVTIKMDQKAKKEVLPFTIINEMAMPSIGTALKEEKKFKFIELDKGKSIVASVKDKTIKFAVVIPENARTTLEKGEQLKIELHFNNASITNKIYQRVVKTLEPLIKEQQKLILAEFNLDEEKLKGLTQPIEIERVNTANKREDIGERFGGMLPYFLIIMILTGAMYPALDMGVGEKERGTLETLLLTPINRSSIVIAKFLVIFTTGFLTIFLTLGSLAVWSVLAMQFMIVEVLQKISELVSVGDIILMFAMLIPVAAIFASLLLCASIYAKNFKEAQNYMSPIMMFAIIPIVFSILPGVKLDSTWAWVPLTNVALAIKELIKGTVDYSMLGIIFVSTTFVAGGLLFFCTRWFNKESVLFRT